ncbi:MAG: 40S ribosomal protein S4 [Amphiamblys sp. WSBS2006]|nr:MAG: 40S ribosomal protein S4 [Amphiamblys sp. WSBS2006]
MARGVKRHLKRVAAPKGWRLSKFGGEFAPKPTSGPHKMRECIPLMLLIRNRLRYALTGKEVKKIVKQRVIKIDKKTRTDTNYPLGLMDVVEIDKTGERFRMLYDMKGRFYSHRITTKEAEHKLCKTKGIYIGKGAIPYLQTHDGRNIRYPDPDIEANDTVRLNLSTGKIDDIIKFKEGVTAMITGGHHIGRIGKVVRIEKHLGGMTMIYMKDERDNDIITRITNVFVIGDERGAQISLLAEKGVKPTIFEERKMRIETGADKRRLE